MSKLRVTSVCLPLILVMWFQGVVFSHGKSLKDSGVNLPVTTRSLRELQNDFLSLEPQTKGTQKGVREQWTGFHPCYSKLCWCNATLANCSGTFGKLKFIPKFPDGITYLDFSRNNITSIPNDDFFANVTNITGLDLSSNKLSSVSKSAFDSLTRLKYLNIRINSLDYDSITALLFNDAWKILSIIDVQIRVLPSYVFSTTSLPSLEILILNNNPVNIVDLSGLLQVNLTQIALASCKITQFISGYLPALIYLDIHSNGILDFPETCQSKTPLFPELRHLDLRMNEISNIPEICLPKLKILDLSMNNLQTVWPYTFSEAKFPSLEKLYLSELGGLQQTLKIKARAFNNSKLQVLSLSHNTMMFPYDDTVDLDAFVGCPSLRELILDYNVFTHIRNYKMQRLFGSLSSLEILRLDLTEMVQLTTDTFSGLSSIRELHLDRNPLVNIPDGAFEPLTNLTILSIVRNKISLITEKTFSVKLRNRLSSLDLSGNPFTCTCDVMWFRQWLLSNQTLFGKSRTSYECNNMYNITLASFYLPEQACLFTRDACTLTVVSVTLLLVTLSLTTVLYHYRWHIRLLLYEAFRDKACDRRQRLLTGNFQYDIFVSYAADNLVWVRDHLMPELEVGMGLRLCVHQRDFIPGKNIVDNIVDNLQTSRKVMMIFSRDFAQSHWCQFELALCLQHVMDHDDVLVIICLQDLASRDLTGAMLAVLKTTTYIQWGDDNDARTSFWGRMEIALNEIIALREH